MRVLPVVLLMLAVVAGSSCRQPEATAPAPASTRTADEDASMPTDRDYHAYRDPAKMADVMQAKLIHTQAIVEGLALGQLEQVKINALELIAISEHAEWKIVDTVTYVALSDMFRDVARELARRAAEGDADASLREFTRLTNSCVTCHSYLRREQLYRDLPGAVSWQGDLVPPQAE